MAGQPGLLRGFRQTRCNNQLLMSSVREIRIARRTGFCYGVREAIDKAKESASTGRVTHTLGQVVHNEGVIADLQRAGVETVETLDDVDRGAAVVIRAHGVRPEVMERAEARGLDVIDGTCTWVIQEQRELIAPGRGGLHDRAPRHAAAIPRSSGCWASRPTRSSSTTRRSGSTIPRRKKMALISQSTQPPWKFEKLAAFMVVAQPRAQDRQHGLPGHDPAPGGHPRDRPRGRPDGRGRRPLDAPTRRS